MTRIIVILFSAFLIFPLKAKTINLENWEYCSKDSQQGQMKNCQWTKLDRLKLLSRKSHSAIYRVRLPNLNLKNPAIRIHGRTSLQLVLNNSIIHRYGEFKKEKVYRNSSPHLILLPESINDSSHLYFIIKSTSSRVGLRNQAFIGEYSDHIKEIFSKEKYDAILGIILLFFALALIVFNFLPALRSRKFVYLAIFSSCFGLWTLASLHPGIHEFAGMNHRPTMDSLMYFACYLIPLPFIAYILEIKGIRFKKILIPLRNLAALLSFFVFLVAIVSPEKLKSFNLYFNILLFFFSAAKFTAISFSVKDGNQESKAILFGAAIFIIGTLLDSSSYLSLSFLGKSPFFQHLTPWSFLVLLILLIYLAFHEHLKLKQELSTISAERKFFKVASQVAHDIKSPLSALKFSMANKNMDNERWEIAQEAIDRIQNIADDMLNHYRSNQNNGQDSKFNLDKLIQSVLKEKEVRLKDTSIQMTYKCDSLGKTASIDKDGKEFKRALSNLINNAIESLPDKRGLIRIELGKDKNNAIVKVVDSGQGIPQKLQDRIFEEGFTIGKKSGSGLGLFQVKSYIDSIGGKILVESGQNSGTRIKLYLPTQST